MKERNKFLLLIALFLAAYFIPFGHPRVSKAILEGFFMLQEYVQEHVLFCLIPALFIAGAISCFFSQRAVIKYFGGEAKKWAAYLVGSVSGAVLAVCSCTVLPLFGGIYKRGAGLGPAIAFLYSGPAINILAIVLTARVLGWELGVARVVGAVGFALVIGLLMAFIYRKDEQERLESSRKLAAELPEEKRTPLQTLSYFLVLIFILVFAAWGKPEGSEGFWLAVYQVKWYLAAALLIILGLMIWRWFDKEEVSSWMDATWFFTKQIIPLLFVGVLVAGFLLGRPGLDNGLIPSEWIATIVGGNSLQANFLASLAGALMYFSTLTEVPILQGLIGSGMGKGPALALLLAGPALSLPSILVIIRMIGAKKGLTYAGLVVVMSTLSGWLYGMFF
ncbi:MAG: permease [Syntrophomonadaceae bacterium]|nr:permease [Syntrophomonadaceae bacterium]